MFGFILLPINNKQQSSCLSNFCLSNKLLFSLGYFFFFFFYNGKGCASEQQLFWQFVFKQWKFTTHLDSNVSTNLA